MRFQVRDDGAPHQIRLFFHKLPGSRTVEVVVSCTCRWKGKATGAGDSYEPMGPAPNAAARDALYHDPDNHNNQKVVYVPPGAGSRGPTNQRQTG